MLLALLVVWQVAAPPSVAASPDCAAEDLAFLDREAQRVARGDDPQVPITASSGGPASRCDLVEVQRRSLEAWTEARRLATAGGAAELQSPVRRALGELERWQDGRAGLEAEYARTAIRAAIAAAQDERPELELLLTHARDLAERLGARGRRARWPRPFNLLAGELWFEVDRYEEARAAYERAVRSDPGAAGVVGLARALARLGRTADACATYARVRAEAPPALAERAHQDLAGCP